jgi:hypothetical protein
VGRDETGGKGLFLEGGLYGKGAWRISCCCPFPSSVKGKSFVADNFEETTTSEGFGIGLSFNLKDIKGQKKDLPNTNQTAPKKAKR